MISKTFITRIFLLPASIGIMASPAFSSTLSNKSVTSVRLMINGNVIIGINGTRTPASCTADFSDSYILTPSMAGTLYNHLLSVVLTAKNTGNPITIAGDNNCYSFTGSGTLEGISYIQLN